jgi:hypothetical protein
MCTVSFIPVDSTIFITSNRDEKLSRKNALVPVVHEYNGVNFIFPKDADAGGTWIVAKENGDAAVILNGAFINHAAEPPYRRSRGLILLDILANENPSAFFSKIDLENIEPFTIVLFQQKSLFEFRWDGIEKFGKQLSVHNAHIWSSATLYEGLTILKREKWFEDFLKLHTLPSQQTVIDFHRFTGDGDSSNDLLMNREGEYQTVSITSIELNNNKITTQYLDLKENKTYLYEAFANAEAVK